ncbi:hypothetical protein K1X84_13440 [bacterium]|nr:hypothetical protein [bacterium]
MNKIIITTLLLSLTGAYTQEINFINYYASNNQIVGVPMIDTKNIFRFYPDVAFQGAIRSAKVYYFVSNDVFESYLLKQKDGRYWECPLRPFELGESIQRVEVILDCEKYMLNELLRQHHIEPTDDDFNNYLLLRRGDDRALFAKSLLQTEANKIEELKRLNTLLGELSTKLKNNINDVDAITDNIGKASKSMKANEETLNKIDISINGLKPLVSDVMERVKSNCDTTIKNELDAIEKKIGNAETLIMSAVSNEQSSIESINKVISNEIASITKDIDQVIHSANVNYQQTFAELSQTQSTSSSAVAVQAQVAPLYSAYVENRNSSLLDIRYKDGEKDIIEFTYRNDKNSLKYLQASDPIEKLSIFRARLVPFAVYGEKGDRTIRWKRDRIIYEIALNFGYAVVKDDNFKPVFFDLNRLGVGIGIAADTFGDQPSFLSVSLSYDINTYSTISFGTNIVDKPFFFMGVGINSRAFKDLVKESAKIFSASSQ